MEEETTEPTKKDVLVEAIKADYFRFASANEEEPEEAEKLAWQHGFIAGYKRGLSEQQE